MRLSELKGERAVEVIADLIEPITNIAMDADNLKLFNNKKMDGESLEDAGIRIFKQRIPALLKTHKTDVLQILTAVNDCDPAEMSVMDIINSLIEVVSDKEFMNLFLSVAKTEEPTPPTESSANVELSKPE